MKRSLESLVHKGCTWTADDVKGNPIDTQHVAVRRRSKLNPYDPFIPFRYISHRGFAGTVEAVLPPSYLPAVSLVAASASEILLVEELSG